MKKIISVLFALCLCMAASAQQHMKFMGIPLDGSIDDFTLKLKAKGVTYNAEKSKDSGPGTRIFNGTFIGEDAIFVVFYNAKSEIVFGAAVELSYLNVESAHMPFMNLLEQLRNKYPTATCEESKDCDGDANGLAFNIPDKTGKNRMGLIIQTLKASSLYTNEGCSIYLMYTDMTNFRKSEAINNEDL